MKAYFIRGPRPVLLGAGRLLIAVGAALALIFAIAGPASAATVLDPANFRLTKSADNNVIADLDAALPNVSVAGVINDANRVGAACTPPASNRLAAFCWNSGDNGTSEWWPQGITTSADADPSSTYDGKTVILAAWYEDVADGVEKGIRVSFVDYSTPSAPKYRHAILVIPTRNTAGQPTYTGVNIHGGGMAWYGPYLYVASTSLGYRVFDMRHIWQVTGTGDKTKVGLQADGTYHAFDYKYVVPQLFTYGQSTAGGYTNLAFSFTGLDRTSSPDSLVMGEYASPGAGTRLVRYPLDEATHLLKTSSDGLVHGTQAYQVDVQSMQGAASINGKYYLSTSDGDANKGDLGTFTPGGSVVLHYDVLPIGPEDFSYWGSKGQLWSLNEYPGNRSVYAIKASAY